MSSTDVVVPRLPFTVSCSRSTGVIRVRLVPYRTVSLGNVDTTGVGETYLVATNPARCRADRRAP